MITFTLKPEEGWIFSHWEGKDRGDIQEKKVGGWTLLMDDNKEITAFFTRKMAMANISGTVTDTRGGPALAGAKVYDGEFPSLYVLTDKEGFFSLNVRAERLFDLIIEKEGYGGTRIQDIYLNEDEKFELTTLSREAVNAGAGGIPPRFAIEGVARNDILSGPYEIHVYFEGGEVPECFGVFYGMQRPELPHPDRKYIPNYDSSYYPNGKSYFFIHAYDHNDGYVAITIPVTIDNEPGEPADDVPQKKQPFIDYNVYTHGKKADLYSLEEPGYPLCDLQSIPADTTIYAFIAWYWNDTAENYRVYRSLGEADFVCVAERVRSDVIGYINHGFYYDFGTDLEPGVPVRYKVVPYNDAGDGWAYEGFFIPLPILKVEVKLEEPAKGESGVPLRPTFNGLMFMILLPKYPLIIFGCMRTSACAYMMKAVRRSTLKN